MVEDTLVREAIADGDHILLALDAIGAEVVAALWFYFRESEKWRLVLAMPIVEEKGARFAYGAIRGAVESLDPTPEYGPGAIRAVSPDDPIIKALGYFRTPAPDLVGMRLGGAYVNGVEFDGAYIYRVPANLAAVRR